MTVVVSTRFKALDSELPERNHNTGTVLEFYLSLMAQDLAT